MIGNFLLYIRYHKSTFHCLFLFRCLYIDHFQNIPSKVYIQLRNGSVDNKLLIFECRTSHRNLKNERLSICIKAIILMYLPGCSAWCLNHHSSMSCSWFSAKVWHCVSPRPISWHNNSWISTNLSSEVL